METTTTPTTTATMMHEVFMHEARQHSPGGSDAAVSMAAAVTVMRVAEVATPDNATQVFEAAMEATPWAAMVDKCEHEVAATAERVYEAARAR